MSEFMWKGENIPDIEKWAEERGEKMVKYRRIRRYPNFYTGRMEQEVYEGSMPETFWYSLTITPQFEYIKLENI
jgi:hypothetical protein